MENTNSNLSEKTKSILKSAGICFILWYLSYWPMRACHNAEPGSILEFYWGATGIGLLISIVFVIIGTIISLSEKD